VNFDPPRRNADDGRRLDAVQQQAADGFSKGQQVFLEQDRASAGPGGLERTVGSGPEFSELEVQ